MEPKIYEGVTKWFGSKGEAFGYIHRFKHTDGSDGEVFVHFRHLSAENQENPKFKVLKKGQKVRFEIGPGYPSGKGTQAFNVVVIPNVRQNPERPEGLSEPAGDLSV